MKKNNKFLLFANRDIAGQHVGLFSLLLFSTMNFQLRPHLKIILGPVHTDFQNLFIMLNRLHLKPIA